MPFSAKTSPANVSLPWLLEFDVGWKIWGFFLLNRLFALVFHNSPLPTVSMWCQMKSPKSESWRTNGAWEKYTIFRVLLHIVSFSRWTRALSWEGVEKRRRRRTSFLFPLLFPSASLFPHPWAAQRHWLVRSHHHSLARHHTNTHAHLKLHQ